MVRLCSMTDVEILNKIRSGEWVPSLDTGLIYSNSKKGFLNVSRSKGGYLTSGGFHRARVIWIAANGPIPYEMEIDHINGDKEDNRLCNLRLVSRSENVSLTKGKVTFTQAEEIRRRYAAGGISQAKLAKEYQVGRNTVLQIVNNRTMTKPVSTDMISAETRKEILSAYKSGRSIDTIRARLKIQRAVARQVLEEELNKEAEERRKQEAKP